MAKEQGWSPKGGEIVVTSHLVEMAELEGPIAIDASPERSRFNDLAGRVAIASATDTDSDELWAELLEATRALKETDFGAASSG